MKALHRNRSAPRRQASAGSRVLVIALLGVIMLVGLGTGSALADPVTEPTSTVPVGSTIITIGDSVMLGARWVLQKDGVKIVDALKNRQASKGLGLLRKRGANLPRNVVVHLGTNGTFTSENCQSMIDVAGPTRRVFLLTLAVPRSWEARNNAIIRACVAANPGRAFIIDWHAMVAQHPKWVYSDGTHLRPAGARGYSQMIEQAVAATS